MSQFISTLTFFFALVIQVISGTKGLSKNTLEILFLTFYLRIFVPIPANPLVGFARLKLQKYKDEDTRANYFCKTQARPFQRGNLPSLLRCQIYDDIRSRQEYKMRSTYSKLSSSNITGIKHKPLFRLEKMAASSELHVHWTGMPGLTDFCFSSDEED